MKISVDTHAHTIASTHAFSTIHDYLQVAKERQLEAFTITDHGVAMPDSPHIYHFVNMKIFPRVMEGIVVFRGMEANILDAAGNLDVPDSLLDKLDLVIASFHEPVISPTNKDDHTQALIGAIQSGKCQVIGHPGNPSYPFDYQAVIREAVKHNVAIEVNNSSFLESRHGSEPNCLGILKVVKELGCMVSVGSDSHISYQLGDFTKSIEAINKVGIDSSRIVNLNLNSFKHFLTFHNKSVVAAL
ncbi:phosphatase [Neiella marina]|uniref:Phosphatase n=1 Tax=Neiella holothuriorum TaxID=2870530 RepID=A0ABS7EKK2_9GAMM|nr:phosphatase [Neiella holothuriorum]MBW8192856.1 phosphatase [Neiella holothuriorum]